MTTCATETATETVRRAGFTTAADGSYAACLAAHGDDDAWYPERWDADGPSPTPSPCPEPARGSRLPARSVDGGPHPPPGCSRTTPPAPDPTGPGMGELPLGSLGAGEEDVAAAAVPDREVLAVAFDAHAATSTVWLVHGGHGSLRGTPVPGRYRLAPWPDCGWMLAPDREAEGGGPVKTVAVDLHRDETSPLLQITEDSDDRLLLAEPDSGLLIVRSNAPGEDRLGWGVLGSHRPVRFPEALRLPGSLPDAVLTPFAAQPGLMLSPEACAIAFTADGPHGASLAIWRPAERHVLWLNGPQGWLPGTGLWTAGGVLRLPYACAQCPCGLVAYEAPAAEPVPLPVPLPVPVAAQEPQPSAVLPLQKAPLATAGPVPAPLELHKITRGHPRRRRSVSNRCAWMFRWAPPLRAPRAQHR